MPITENTPKKLVLQSGSSTLILDKGAGTVTLQRKLLMWGRKPIEFKLSELADTAVDAAVDRASGIEVCNTMLIMKGGQGLAMPAADKKEAQANAAAIRKFVGLKG